VLGIPVGFVGAAESKDALAHTDLEHLVVRGRRGGSAIAAAALNALAEEREILPVTERAAGAGTAPTSVREAGR